MSLQELMSMVPPETWLGIVVSATTLALAGLGGAGYLFRQWFLNKLDMTSKVNASELESLRSRIDLERLEMQNQLDQTQSGREMLRLQSSELVESRNAFLDIIKAMREDAKNSETRHEKFLNELAETNRNLHVTSVATLNLLEKHKEGDEIMGIKQERIISQNDKTHERIAQLIHDVASIGIKLESLTVNRAQDRQIIEELRGGLDKIQEGIKHLEEYASKPIVEELKIAVSTALEKTQPLEINEFAKEFSEGNKPE